MNYATHGEIFTSLISGEHRRILAGRQSEEKVKCILMPVAELKSSAKDTVMSRTSHAKGRRNVDIQEQSKAKQSKGKLPSHHNDKEFKNVRVFIETHQKSLQMSSAFIPFITEKVWIYLFRIWSTSFWISYHCESTKKIKTNLFVLN